MNKRTLRSLDPATLARQRVLVRVDYNVPLGDGGQVEDATRIEATLPTLRLLLDARAHPVLLSHLGRPGGKVVPDLSLAPVARALEERLGAARVHFCPETDSGRALEASRAVPPGDVLLLENTRFLPGETKNDPGLSRRLAGLGDVYVNDAFGSTHRAHASVVGVTEFLRPAVAGLLVEEELRALSKLRDEPQRPFVVAFGGAKIGDKMPLVEAFVERANTLLVGGAMANTFFAAAGYETGKSLVEDEAVSFAEDLLGREGIDLELPADVVVGDPEEPGDGEVVAADAIPADRAAYDIGPDTRERFGAVIRDAATFFWNGPMGWFEREAYAAGTRAVAQAAADAAQAGAFSVIGGGDSARAVHEAGLSERVSHVSTGGGASLEYLAHGTLPGLEALDDAP